MKDFHFASPSLLFALLALPVLAFAFRRFDRGAREKLRRFLADENLHRLLLERGTVRERGKKLAFWAGLALLLLALARPQANPTVEELHSSGLDIYVLLDVSKSMDAEDVAPSRLKKAKRTVQHLTSRLAGDRVGIIAFANSSVLVSPLTNDYSILESYLQNIDTSVISSQGTNLGAALETARDAMERGAKNTAAAEAHTNIFLVLSDGEDHGDSDLSVVDTIRKEGGLVFTIAYGTDKGAPIPMRDDKGELRGYKKDRAGNVVVTEVKSEVLAEVAKRGGGQFYHSTVEEGEVEDILARVNDAQRGSFATIRTTVWEEYFWVFLAPGLLLLLISFVPLRALARVPGAVTRLRGRAGLAGKSALVALLLLPPARAHAGPISFFWNKDRKASEQSHALAQQKKYSDAVDVLKGLQAENPDSPELNYDIGTYLLADKKGRLGREQLSHLRNADGILRDMALFNTAGSYAQEGMKDEARAAYAELLEHLGRKQKLADAESALLAEAKRNVARLADPAQAPQPQPDKSDQQQQSQGGGDSQKQQSQGGQGQDQKKDQPQNGDKNKDEKQGDQPKGGQKPNDEKKKGDEGEKKDEKKGDQGKDEKKKEQEKDQGQEPKQGQQGQEGKNQDSLPARRGGQPFRERDEMGEEDAKRILGALRERESDLQKKFLKNQVKGGRVNADDAAKDW
jgi:Ca-activated chloride channel family protein